MLCRHLWHHVFFFSLLFTCSWCNVNTCVTPFSAPDSEWKSDSDIWKCHSLGFSVPSKRQGKKKKCTFNVTRWHFKPGAESPKYKHLKSPSKTFLPRCRHPNSQHNQAPVTASCPALFFFFLFFSLVSPAEGSDSRGEKLIKRSSRAEEPRRMPLLF